MSNMRWMNCWRVSEGISVLAEMKFLTRGMKGRVASASWVDVQCCGQRGRWQRSVQVPRFL